MKRSSSKISFDLQKPAAPKAAEPQTDAVPRVQVKASVEGVSKKMPVPPVAATSPEKPAAKPTAAVSKPKAAAPKAPAQPKEEPKWHTANEPKAFHRPTPKPPVFAATGLMAPEPDGFFQRNAKMLGMGGTAALIVVLGTIMTFSLSDDGGTQQFSSPEALPVQEMATRSVAADLTDVSAAADTTIQETVSTPSALGETVLAGLKPVVQPEKPAALAAPKVAGGALLEGAKLNQLREGVLGGEYSVAVVEADGVRRVELLTRDMDMTPGQEEAFMLEAAKGDLLGETGALRTPAGDLDSKTMIFDVVQRSLLADENSASSEAALDMSRKVFAASIARTQFVNGQRLYTVQPGDSLAYIALQFFGMPGEYKRILDANRSTLQSPDKIQVGQRLVIPS